MEGWSSATHFLNRDRFRLAPHPQTHVTLVVETESQKGLEELLRSQAVNKLAGNPGTSYFGIVYRFSETVERTSAPHRRLPPLQDRFAEKAVQAALSARNNSDSRTIPGACGRFRLVCLEL